MQEVKQTTKTKGKKGKDEKRTVRKKGRNHEEEIGGESGADPPCDLCSLFQSLCVKRHAGMRCLHDCECVIVSRHWRVC